MRQETAANHVYSSICHKKVTQARVDTVDTDIHELPPPPKSSKQRNAMKTLFLESSLHGSEYAHI